MVVCHQSDEQEKTHLKMITDCHSIDLSVLLGERLQTDAKDGLTSKEHKLRLDKNGPNQMSPPKTTPKWLRFLKSMTGFFSLLLLSGSLLCFLGYGLKNDIENLYLGIVLFVVVLLSGSFSYFQEKKSGDLMDSFKKLLPDLCTVVRDGHPSQVNAESLVVGDIVLLKAGDKVPADMRILECSDDMQVDNACLTGESEPCKRSISCTDTNPLETQNLVFFGTQVPKGSCKGVVVLTGDNTMMGHIAKLTVNTDSEKTPIAMELDRFIKVISIVAITLGIVFFVIGCFLGTDLITNLVFMIGIIVANVPEGLLVTVTVSLSLTANRMSSKNVLVKNLEGVETLGSTSCICSDKTGTLTQNMMTVTNVVIDGMIYDCECSMYVNPTVDQTSISYSHLIRVAALCNNAKWDDNSKFRKTCDGLPDRGNPQPFIEELVMGDGSTEKRVMWKPLGDASESALIKYVQASFDIDVFRYDHPKLKEIPFNSSNKYQVSIHKQPDSFDHLLVMKGAPEPILTRCNTCLMKGEVIPFTPEMKHQVEQLQVELSRKGLRVLGFAELVLDHVLYPDDYPYNSEVPNSPLGDDEASFPKEVLHTDQIFTKLCFVGMMAMIDPPRPQVPPAVEKCKTAGIRVIMVTGDHPVTAKAIAQKVGIIWGDTADDIEYRNHERGLNEGDPGWEDPAFAPAIVVPGWDLTPDLPDVIWNDILDHPQVVFARTSPQQKLIIVEHIQKRGEIVAVTGDGVNDAPALRKADIGIAMGIMGSAVSKEAADMILVDDNFASIVKGIEEGRLIFDNLKKSIAYTLSSNIPEIVPFLAFMTLQIPLPLDTILILLIDLGTDMLPAISFAYETPEADIMKRPPRDSKRDHLVNRKLLSFSYLQIGVMQCLAAFFAWFVMMNSYGYPPHVLMGLGANDNWGKQTLYCKVKGGNWYREIVENDHSVFESYSQPIHSVQEFHNMFKKGYYFWYPDEEGSIEGCYHAAKTVKGRLKTIPDFTLSNPLSYRDENGDAFTGQNVVVSSETIDVLLNRGYYPYLPLQSRVSPFWKNEWLQESLENGRNLGLTGSESFKLSYQPAGYWLIDRSDTGVENQSLVDKRVQRMIEEDSEWMGNRVFSKVEFRQTRSVDDPHYLHSLTMEVNGEMTINIASRMMQSEALHFSQTTYLITIIIVQVGDLLICKTRLLSLIEQGMNNTAMNSALLFELMLSCALLYIPFLNDILRTRPLSFFSWLIGIPFMIVIVLYDELRKYLIRKTSTVSMIAETKQIIRTPGWIERNSYYYCVCSNIHDDSLNSIHLLRAPHKSLLINILLVRTTKG